MSINLAVYSFYYVRSRLVNNILWRGKKCLNQIVSIMIPGMGIFGLFVFWVPINDVLFYGFIKDGGCHLAVRRWILIVLVAGDSILSIILLLLFIRPITVIEESLGDTPRSVATLQLMRKMTERNRNLLLFTLMVTMIMFTTTAVIGSLNMRTVLFMGTMDRLVTLQCITMTFSYDKRKCFYCRDCFTVCFQTRTQELEQEQDFGYQNMDKQDVGYQNMDKQDVGFPSMSSLSSSSTLSMIPSSTRYQRLKG